MDLKLTELKLAKLHDKSYLVFNFEVDQQENFASVSLDYLKSFYSYIVNGQERLYLEFSEDIHGLEWFETVNSSNDLKSAGDNVYHVPYNHELVKDLLEKVL